MKDEDLIKWMERDRIILTIFIISLFVTTILFVTSHLLNNYFLYNIGSVVGVALIFSMGGYSLHNLWRKI